MIDDRSSWCSASPRSCCSASTRSTLTPTARSPTQTSAPGGRFMPATRNLTIYMGDVYDHEITFTDGAGAPIDMTGTWRAQIRKRVDAASAMVAFTVDTTDAATGVIVLSLSKAQTAALTKGAAHWDLEETGTGVTYLRGTVAITQDVSR